MFEVGLRSSPAAAPRALFREPCARDEFLPAGAGPVVVTELIAALLVDQPSPWLQRADVWCLSLGDRDRIVARLHTQCFGDAVESIVPCSACEKRFEIHFSLAALVESVEPPPSPLHPGAAGPDGAYTLSDGRRLRLPSTDDERAVAGWPLEQAAEELLRRCVVDGTATADDAVIEEALESLSPVLDVDVPATCANCGEAQAVHFDMVSFFVATLARERPILLGEIHRLAATYHWSCDEILGLPRSLRRAHVALIEADRGTLQAAS